jgi:hypothetical protein
MNHQNVGTVKIKTNTPKLADCSIQCVVVGYALGHLGDTYKARDVIWHMINQSPNKHPTTIKEDSQQATKNVTITAEEQDKSDKSDADEVETENGLVAQTWSGQTMQLKQQMILL